MTIKATVTTKTDRSKNPIARRGNRTMADQMYDGVSDGPVGIFAVPECLDSLGETMIIQ